MTGLRRSPMSPRTGRLPRRVSPMDTRRPRPVTVAIVPEWSAVRPVIYARCGYRCERCGSPFTLAGMQAHHRKRRDMGDHSVGNAAALCPPCHADVHQHPAESIVHGWIVPTWADPACRAVPLHDGRVVHLDAAGGYEAVR